MPFPVDLESDEEAARRRAIARRDIANSIPASHPGMAAVRGYMEGVRKRELDDALTATSRHSDVSIPKSEDGMTAVRGYMQATQSPKPIQAQSTPNGDEPGFYSGLGRAAFQGLTFGFGDEIEARLATLSGPESYREELKRVRGEIDRFQEAYPKYALGAEVAGSLPTLFMPAGAIARGASVASKLGRGAFAGGKARPTSKIAAGAKAVGSVVNTNIGRGLATGMTVGGLSDIGHGQGNFRERLTSAGDGALIGAVAGGAVPVVGRALTSGLSKVGSRGVPARQKELGHVPETMELLGDVLSGLRGLRAKPDAFKGLYSKLKKELHETHGTATKDAQNFVKTVGRLSRGKKAVPLDKIVTELRTAARGVKGTKGGNDDALQLAITDGLDDFIAKLKREDLLGPKRGPNRHRLPNEEDFTKTKEKFQRYTKAQILDDVHRAAGKYSPVAKLQEQFETLARDKDLMARFSESEREAIQAAAQGSVSEKAIRVVELLTGGRVVSSVTKELGRRLINT